MLLFSFSCDLFGEAKEKLKMELERYTGEECILLPMCTGIFRIPESTVSDSREEGTYESSKGNEDRNSGQ